MMTGLPNDCPDPTELARALRDNAVDAHPAVFLGVVPITSDSPPVTTMLSGPDPYSVLAGVKYASRDLYQHGLRLAWIILVVDGYAYEPADYDPDRVTDGPSPSEAVRFGLPGASEVINVIAALPNGETRLCSTRYRREGPAIVWDEPYDGEIEGPLAMAVLDAVAP